MPKKVLISLSMHIPGDIPGGYPLRNPATLTDTLRNTCLSDEFSDVSFVIDDKDILAHKVVLAARSTVFKTMLFGPQSSEEPHSRIKILDPVTTTAYFTDFLRLIYDRDVELNVNTAIGIYHLAQYYDVPAILKTCSDYLNKKVSVDNALTIGEAVYLYEGKVWDHINWFIGENAFETLGTPILATLSARFIVKLLYWYWDLQTAFSVKTRCEVVW